MTTITATYSPEDNKLRIYASQRLDRETYDRIRAAGFAWAPRQDLFVAPMWTPARADLCIELAGEIEDEGRSIAERAEDRAERFAEYERKRASESASALRHVEAITSGIPLGQPILIGHHSQRHAERDAKRIEAGMQKAVDLWETSEYWKRRAAGALRHALYKEDPAVRHRRIKGLEADERKHAKELEGVETFSRLWDTAVTGGKGWKTHTKDGTETTPLSRTMTLANMSGAGACDYGLLGRLEAGEVTPEQAREEAMAALARRQAWASRWLNHIRLRLEYERAMLGEGGGIAADRFDIQIGGRVLVDREWCAVLKVNRRGGAISSLKVARRYVPTIGIEDVQDYREPTPEDAEKAAAAAKAPPLCNYPGEGFHHMTRAEWEKIHADYKGSRVLGAKVERETNTARAQVPAGIAAAAAELMPHRVRSAILPGISGLTPVYLTDAKLTPAPKVGDLPKGAARGPWSKPAQAPEPVRFERIPATVEEAGPEPVRKSAEPSPIDAVREALRTGVQVVSAPQLFPTPPDLAARMVALAGVKPGARVLEPSAGTGRILDAIAAAVPLDRLEVSAHEINREMAGALQARHPAALVRCGDFLEAPANSAGGYDVILMNPPFAKAADVEHVTHAAAMLAPGGRLVAIMSAGVTFRDDRRTRDFRRMVERMAGSIEALPADTFASSGTGVNTVIVTLRRPPATVAERVQELREIPGMDVQLAAGIAAAEVTRTQEAKPCTDPARVAEIVRGTLETRCMWAAPGTPTAEDLAGAAAKLDEGAALLAREPEGEALARDYRAAAAMLRDSLASTEALGLILRMNATDCFDYLADFGNEPGPDDRHPDKLRSLLLADVWRTGPAVFCERMREAFTSA